SASRPLSSLRRSLPVRRRNSHRPRCPPPSCARAIRVDAPAAAPSQSAPHMTTHPRSAKPVKESQHESSELMMPQDANNLGHIFGGVILSLMDKTAAISAFRHSRASVVTASIDRVDFREPIHLGDLVIMKSSVYYV